MLLLAYAKELSPIHAKANRHDKERLLERTGVRGGRIFRRVLGEHALVNLKLQDDHGCGIGYAETTSSAALITTRNHEVTLPPGSVPMALPMSVLRTRLSPSGFHAPPLRAASSINDRRSLIFILKNFEPRAPDDHQWLRTICS